MPLRKPLDVTGYKFQCGGCLDEALKIEKNRRDDLMRAWHTKWNRVDGPRDSTPEIIQKWEEYPEFVYELTHKELHAELVPFIPGVEAVINHDEDGVTTALCPDCDEVLMTHEER